MTPLLKPVRRALTPLIWLLFGLAVEAATAPVWQRAAYGFNPTLDEILRLTICRPVSVS